MYSLYEIDLLRQENIQSLSKLIIGTLRFRTENAKLEQIIEGHTRREAKKINNK